MRQSRTFPPRPASVAAARRFARAAVGCVAPEVIESVELMVSELATNCVTHSHTTFELTVITAAGTIRVEATDSAAGEPAVQSPRPEDPHGRGLRIVDLLSERWGVRRKGRTKTVWFTVASTNPAARSQTPAS